MQKRKSIKIDEDFFKSFKNIFYLLQHTSTIVITVNANTTTAYFYFYIQYGNAKTIIANASSASYNANYTTVNANTDANSYRLRNSFLFFIMNTFFNK